METIQSLDYEAFHVINNLASSLSWLNPIIIFFAEYAIFALAVLMILLWVAKPHMRKTLIAAFIAFVLAAILAKISGQFFSHPQPFANPDLAPVHQLISKKIGNAFPSDHTAAAFAVCVTLFIGSKAKGKFLYIILALLMGISRIWVGVHYPSDVLAGILIGTLTALIVYPFVMRSKFIAEFLNFYRNIESKLIGSPGKHQKK